MPIDAAIDVAARGANLVALELPALATGEVDEELADTVVRLITRLLHRRIEIYDGDTEQPITAAMIGVTYAHVSQVNAIRERLPVNLSEVLVETSDRFQGLERPVMVVHPSALGPR